MKNTRLGIIFAIVFIDLLGFGMILPFLPFYAKEYGASDVLIGVLIASYPAAQVVGAPILGRLSDRFGRRPILLLSILGTAISYLMLAFANSLGMLFASRIIDGITGGNISVAQSYITDVTDRKDRARGLGLVGAAFGLGFILGPAFAGLLTPAGAAIDARVTGPIVWEFALPALIAAGLAFINTIAVYFYLPESLSEEQREELAKRPRDEFQLRNLVNTFRRPRVGPLLNIRFFSSLAFSMLTTIFSLYALNKFELGASQTAYILTYVGVLSALMQGGGIGILTKRFQEKWLVFVSSVVLALSLVIWGLAPTIFVLLLVLMPIAFGGGVLNTVVNSLLTKSVTNEEIGGTLGISSGVESSTRVVAPLLGASLLETLGTWAPGIFGGIVMGGLSPYIYWRLIARPDPPLPEEDEPAFDVSQTLTGSVPETLPDP
jgi:DHA1 family tetracycline resistance protein-like MFS transporter